MEQVEKLMLSGAFIIHALPRMARYDPRQISIRGVLIAFTVWVLVYKVQIFLCRYNQPIISICKESCHRQRNR